MRRTCSIASSDTPTLHAYGELDVEASGAFDAHLRQCAQCATVMAELSDVREALADRAAVRRSDREWTGFMRRLEDSLRRSPMDSALVPRSPTDSALVRRSPKGVGVWLPLAAMLVLGVALGLLWQQRALGPRHQQVADAAASAAALDTAAARHFERAKLVVLGLAMKDPEHAAATDWQYERELATSLLPETRLFRLSAMDRGDTRLAALLGDLEAVLLQASLATDAETPELKRLQRIIRGRDLIVRMDLRNDSVQGI